MPKFSTLLGRRHAKGAITTRPRQIRACRTGKPFFLGSLASFRAMPTCLPSLQPCKICHDATIRETNNNSDYRPSCSPARASYNVQIRLAKTFAPVAPHIVAHSATAAAYTPFVHTKNEAGQSRPRAAGFFGANCGQPFICRKFLRLWLGGRLGLECDPVFLKALCARARRGTVRRRMFLPWKSAQTLKPRHCGVETA